MTNNKILVALIIFILAVLKLASAISVDAEYITIYPGEDGDVSVIIDNNENFDIEDISVSLDLSKLPFSTIGNSEDNIGDINEDDDDSVSFTIKASTDITPGDYNIPYKIKYVNSDNNDDLQKEGSFGIRVSSKTDVDFSAETQGNAIVGRGGKISLEIINKGLGEIKSVSVQLIPNGYELLSKDKIFIGSIDGDDTDSASFEVIYKSANPVLSAKIVFKDFDNKEQIKNVNIPLKVYTEEEALKLGIIKKSNIGIYLGSLVILILAWIIYRKIRKSKKKNGG
jgi:hypothetical protein